MGITVFAGMLGVTLFGLLLTPVFYVAIRKLTQRARTPKSGAEQPVSSGPLPEHSTV